MVKYTGRGLVVKRLGVLSKVQMLNLVLGVGVFSLLPILEGEFGDNWPSNLGNATYIGRRICDTPWFETTVLVQKIGWNKCQEVENVTWPF